MRLRDPTARYNVLQHNVSLKNVIWRDRSATFKSKKCHMTRPVRNVLKFYKVMAVPAMPYASEKWTVNWSDKRKLELTEIQILRPVAEFTLPDQKRSVDIRSWLKIFRLNEIKGRLAWMHFKNDKRLPKILLNYKPRVYRNIRRSRARWCIVLK
jgi:hypothetical protein